jgi:hypothetical protein
MRKLTLTLAMVAALWAQSASALLAPGVLLQFYGESVVAVSPAAPAAATPVGWLASLFGASVAVGYYGLEWLVVGQGDSGKDIRIPLTALPASIPPPPASVPATGPGQVSYRNPSYFVGGVFFQGAVFGSKDAAFADFVSKINAEAASYPRPIDRRVYSVCSGYQISWVEGDGTPVGCSNPGGTWTTGCDAGYTFNGNNCSLVEPRAAQRDGHCDYKIVSGAMQSYGDLDCADNGSPSGMLQADGSLLVSGKDDQGRIVLYSVKPTPYGGATATRSLQLQDATGQTQIQAQQLSVNSNATIAAKTQTLQYGSLQPILDGQAYQYTPTQSPSGQQQGNVTINLPTDYARQGEAENSQVATRTKIDRLHDDLSQSTPMTDPTFDPSGWDAAWFGSAFNPLLGWRLPAHAAICPAVNFPEIAFYGGSVGPYHVVEHCDLYTDHAQVISDAMVAVFTLGALFIVLRA